MIFGWQNTTPRSIRSSLAFFSVFSFDPEQHARSRGKRNRRQTCVAPDVANSSRGRTWKRPFASATIIYDQDGGECNSNSPQRKGRRGKHVNFHSGTRSVAVKPTDDSIAATITILIRLPDDRQAPTKLTLDSSLTHTLDPSLTCQQSNVPKAYTNSHATN